MKKSGVMVLIKRVAEASVAWGAFFLLKALPIDVASAAMGKFTRFVGPFIPVSNVARVNLDIAFPDKSAVEKKEILRGCWENLGRVVGEFPHLEKIVAEQKRITLIGQQYVDEIRARGKSAIFFSGHIANWEIFGAVSHQQGVPLSLVYRPASNPLTEALYSYARRNIARALYPKNREGAKQIVKALRGSEVLAMLVDQKMNDGTEVPFFGKPAMTAKAIGEFSLRQNVPIYPARIKRNKGVSFTVEVMPALVMPNTGDHTQNVLALLTTINQLLESWITEKPEDWFWLHRRWPKPLYIN
jgi:KDO2-lipid IV(A) lauroyltransferase